MLIPIYFSPTTPDLYMFMLCYKNGTFPFAFRCFWITPFLCKSGGLAREQIRDALPPYLPNSSDRWSLFNHHALQTHPLGISTKNTPAKIALYFPQPEIVPNVLAGIYRYTYADQQAVVSPPSAWKLPEDDCRAILESQLLSLRLRSRGIVPKRIYIVGGNSKMILLFQYKSRVISHLAGRRPTLSYNSISELMLTQKIA